MRTERLQRQLDDATNELSDIRSRGKKLTEAIAKLVQDFAEDHRCGEKSLNYALDYTADALVDLIDDAEGPAARRKVRLEDEIGRLEDADMRLSAPVHS